MAMAATRPPGAWPANPRHGGRGAPLIRSKRDQALAQAASRRCSSGLDLTLSAGSLTWVGGRNGAGKTTMLRIAAGLIDPDGGSGPGVGRHPRARAAPATSAWCRSFPPETAASTRASPCAASSSSAPASR